MTRLQYDTVCVRYEALDRHTHTRTSQTLVMLTYKYYIYAHARIFFYKTNV